MALIARRSFGLSVDHAERLLREAAGAEGLEIHREGPHLAVRRGGVWILMRSLDPAAIVADVIIEREPGLAGVRRTHRAPGLAGVRRTHRARRHIVGVWKALRAASRSRRRGLLPCASAAPGVGEVASQGAGTDG